MSDEKPTEQEPEFPRGPALLGQIYSMHSPLGQMVCIMSEETWIRFGTLQEQMRQMLNKQDARIKELLAENAVATQVAAEAKTKLENIRHIRRNELRARIEPEVENLIMPGDNKFVVPSKRKN